MRRREEVVLRLRLCQSMAPRQLVGVGTCAEILGGATKASRAVSTRCFFLPSSHSYSGLSTAAPPTSPGGTLPSFLSGASPLPHGRVVSPSLPSKEEGDPEGGPPLHPLATTPGQLQTASSVDVSACQDQNQRRVGLSLSQGDHTAMEGPSACLESAQATRLPRHAMALIPVWSLALDVMPSPW